MNETEYLERPGDMLSWQRGSDSICCQWIMDPDAPYMTLENVNYGPRVSGVYALSGAEGELLYIGKSLSIQTRIVQHYWGMKYRAGKQFERFSWIHVPPFALGDVEIAHIDALRPPLNVLFEQPTWPGHSVLVNKVLETWESAIERSTYA